MSRKHSNISIFVPHIGCPNKCSFCNQRYITGACKGPGADDVGAAVAAAQSSKNYDPATTEIAFFGGSLQPMAGFTRISPSCTAFSNAERQVA